MLTLNAIVKKLQSNFNALQRYKIIMLNKAQKNFAHFFYSKQCDMNLEG